MGSLSLIGLVETVFISEFRPWVVGFYVFLFIFILGHLVTVYKLKTTNSMGFYILICMTWVTRELFVPPFKLLHWFVMWAYISCLLLLFLFIFICSTWNSL